jgi:hypothetical protein
MEDNIKYVGQLDSFELSISPGQTAYSHTFEVQYDISPTEIHYTCGKSYSVSITTTGFTISDLENIDGVSGTVYVIYDPQIEFTSLS